MRNNIAAVIAYLLIITVKSDVDVPSCKVLDVQPLQMPFTGDGLIMVERIVSQPTILCPEDEITVDNYGCTYCNRTETMACQGSSVTALPEPKDLPDIKFSLRVLGSWITYIKRQAFFGKHIKELHIEDNEFIMFHAEAFYGLSDTEYLSLANNNLAQIPCQLLDPLKDLVTLVLDDNGIEFPKVPPNATTCDEEHTLLTKLEYLLLQNNKLNDLPHNAFDWLNKSKLRYMSLRGSKIMYAHPDALKPLFENLKGLEMADSSSLVDTLANITAGLVYGEKSKLEYLGLSSTGLIEIPKKALSNVGQSLLGLALQGNTFHRLDQDSFPVMEALQTLDLRRCSILALLGKAFQGLKALKNLYLSGNRFKILQDEPFKALSKLEFLDLSNNPDPILSDQDATYKIKNHTFSGLENLKILNLAHSRIKYIENGTFYDMPQLTTLSLCNTLVDLGSNFLQAVPNLRILDLSNNENLKFEPSVFKGLGNLEKLRLINCNIEFKPDSDVDYFIHMPNLTDLHLSYNKISTIPKDTFQSLPELKSIHLDHNLLDSWTTKIFENNTKLVLIDVDNNQICHFANETAEELLKTEHISFEYNPLLCDCSLYNFVQELVQSDVTVSHWLEEDNSYSCYDTENERSLLIAHYLPNCAVLENKAPPVDPDSDSTVVAIISGSAIVAICLIIVPAATVVYKKRSKLRYFGIMVKNALSVALMDDDNEESQEDAIFIYDVFVSYCDADREWVIKKLLPELEQENNLRVCLHERDFQPGCGILDNIVHCIDKSRSLIIVVSKKSLKSQWCHFEMHLAQHRFIETRKEQLILVLMEELPRKQRPRTLHYLMATRTFLLWNEKQSELFWKRLRRVLILEKSRAVSIV
ncbi:toll-like receptor 13 [Cloeon dipterum]|uniref:toll-like receptor 13 n=1 Tax=Cloeon dipterum TaxID=197152 RepID=UPI0032202756